jgi:hypothetical protein
LSGGSSGNEALKRRSDSPEHPGPKANGGGHENPENENVGNVGRIVRECPDKCRDDISDGVYHACEQCAEINHVKFPHSLSIQACDWHWQVKGNPRREGSAGSI